MPNEVTIVSYRELLESYDLSYTSQGYFFCVGTPPAQSAWVIHLSAITTQVFDLLDLVIPQLKIAQVPFKIPQTFYIADLLLKGSYGYALSGKVVTIYTSSAGQAVQLVSDLMPLTSKFRGPGIPTDFALGGNIYVRWEANPQEETSYATDFSIPLVPEQGWPFERLSAPWSEQSCTDLEGEARYLYRDVLKEDVKGKVYKMIRMTGGLIGGFRQCIVKQGRKNMMCDLQERDMRERLKWQHALFLRLKGQLPLAEIYEYFESEGDGYLAIEWLGGQSLDKMLAEIYYYQGYQDLTPQTRKILLDYLLKITDIITRTHDLGYVHRDLTPGNFHIDGKKIFLMDLELMYSIDQDDPSPAFGIGTPGYMSPAQNKQELPVFQDDIYSLGAIIFKVLTGINPRRLSIHTEQNIQFFVKQPEIARLIFRCLDSKPQARPSLAEIRQVIERELNTARPMAEEPGSYRLDPARIQELAEKSFASLSETFMHYQNLWHSYMAPDQLLPNEREQAMVWYGFYYGIPGVLYLMARAKACGLSITQHRKQIEAAWGYLFRVIAAKPLPQGLKDGAAGVGLAIQENLKAQALVAHSSVLQILETMAQPQAAGLSVPYGLAGDGLFLLNATDIPDQQRIVSLLQEAARTLTGAQHIDGSWIERDSSGAMVSLPAGLDGVSGILLFLLEYHHRYKDPAVLTSIKKGLKWLRSQFDKSYGKLTPKNNRLDFGLNSGIAGMALAYIKAYQVLQKDEYKDDAVSLLHIFKDHFIPVDLSLGKGLAGLGFVYLEAFRIFGIQQFRDRAEFLLGVLNHTANVHDQSCYWFLFNEPSPTAAFFNGNGGLIYFLLKYLHPNKILFPGLTH